MDATSAIGNRTTSDAGVSGRQHALISTATHKRFWKRRRVHVFCTQGPKMREGRPLTGSAQGTIPGVPPASPAVAVPTYTTSGADSIATTNPLVAEALRTNSKADRLLSQRVSLWGALECHLRVLHRELCGNDI